MTQLLDHNSTLAGKTELDLFTVPPTQIAIDAGYWLEVYPKNTVTSAGPFEFEVNRDPYMLDLSRNYIHMILSIRKKDGTAVPTAAAPEDGDALVYPVSCINLLGKTFFRTLKVFLNSKLIEDSQDLYAYAAYIQTLLNYGKGPKKTYLQGAMYYSDRAGFMDADQLNYGFRARAMWCDASRKFEVMAPLHCGIFNQERLMLSNINIKLELHRNTDNFCLMVPETDTTEYTIAVHSMKWYLRRVDVMKTLQLGIERYLTRDTAKYPIRRVMLKTVHIDSAQREVPNTILFTGQIPCRIILGFVSQEGYHGAPAKNPFKFLNYSIEQVQITAGGNTYPRNPMYLDFPNMRYTRAYMGLFESLNLAGEDRSNAISYHDYPEGYCLFGFDLTPDNSDSGHWDLIKDGTTSLKVKFGSDDHETVKAIVFAEFDNLLTLDFHRNTFFDYGI